jgi:hypothetical protein
MTVDGGGAEGATVSDETSGQPDDILRVEHISKRYGAVTALIDVNLHLGRGEVLGLGLKFTYNKKYTLELNMVDYANDTYDPLFDRDYYSVSAGVTF